MNDLVMTVKQDEERFITDLIETKGDNLPAVIGDVVRIFEFTDWKAKAWKTFADKVSRLEEQSELYHSALRSGQQWGIASLYAQKRMGEITREIPLGKSIPIGGASPGGAKPSATPGKIDTLKTQGINRHTYQDAERIASHPEVLDRVIEQSKEKDEIPTKTAVLREIKRQEADRIDRNIKERKEKEIDRGVKEHPKPVKDYLDAMRDYKQALRFAIEVAKRDIFSPEAMQFVRNSHEGIKKLMNELEESNGS